MTDYRKRFVRDAGERGFVLTERDVAAVLLTWDHRWLTRPQYQRLLEMPCVARTNHLLRRLWDHTYLERLKVGTVGGGMQPVYTVGPTGIPLVANRTDHGLAQIRARVREDGRAGAVLLPHDLEVNDLRIAVTLAIDRHAATALDCWLTADRCYDASTDGVFRPDGYFRIWSRGVLASYFLELDRGTMNLTRWSQKVSRYLRYRDSGAYTARYSLERFRVLVTAPSDRRLRELREATARLTGRGFWFGLTSEIIANPAPDQPIWHPVGADRPRALVTAEGGH